MSFRVGGGWRNINPRRRLPGMALSLELLEGRLVPALDISLSSSSFAQGLVGGESVGTLSVTGNTTPQKYSFILAQGTGDTDNSRFQIRENMLEIAQSSFNSFTANATYSILVQATGTAAGDIVLKTIQVTAKADLVVNISGDVTNSTDGKLSLREALALANAEPDHDRIVFDADQVGAEVTLATIGGDVQGPSALVVSAPVSVDGGSKHILIRQGPAAQEARLFAITQSGSLRLERIDLRGGLAKGTPGDPEGRGGAVLALGRFSLFSGSIVGASAVGLDGGTQPGGAKGGAIYAESDLHLFQATISGNAATGGSGTSATGQPVMGSSAGGGLFVSSPAGNHAVMLELSTIADNTAAAGAGLAILPPTAAAGGAGAFLSINVSGSVLADNKSGNDADILSGGAPQTVSFSGNNSFAETIGQSLSSAGFQVGETSLGPIGMPPNPPVHRPLPGSPLIGAVSGNFPTLDQTGLDRHFPSAAGAAEFFAAPDNITLDNSAFPAAFPRGASIGILKASGANAGFRFNFSLVQGAADNGLFEVLESDLRPAPGAVFTPNTNYTLRVRATGQTGLSFEKDLTVLAKADIVVDTAADITDAADGKTSLREAVISAAVSAGPDRISFAPSLAGATVLLGEDSSLPKSAIFVTSDILITGENSPGIKLRPQAGKDIRLFQVPHSIALGLKDLTITGGRAVNGRGGAILSEFGKVFLDSVTLVDNSASGEGAAGGAVAVEGGELSVSNSTFSDNRVESATGQFTGTGEGGHLLLVASGETGSPGFGNTIIARPAALTISGSTFDGGKATGGTGGVALVSAQTFRAPSAEITGSVFSRSSGADLSASAVPAAPGFIFSGGGNFAGSAPILPPGLFAGTGDAMLGALADNGGTAFTIAPLPGSPLTSPTNPARGLLVDQRGVARTAPFSIGAHQVVLATGTTISPSGGLLGIGAKVDVNILFSQPVLVSGTPRIALNMPGAFATAVNPGQPAASITFRYIVTAGNFSQGISIASGAALDFSTGTITDKAGAPVQVQVPAPVAPGAAVDGVAPAPFVGFASPLPSNPSNAAGFASFANFGETGLFGTLAPDDFNLVNATVSSISGPDASGKYSFLVSPVADGAVQFSLRQGALADAAGNPSVATPPVSIVSDRTAPVPVVALTPSPGPVSASSSFAGVVSFSEPVSAFSVSGFDFSNATVTGFTGPDGQGKYFFTLLPAGDSKVFLSVKAGAVSDAAGNPSKASSAISFVSDRKAPAVTVVSPPSVGSTSDGGRAIFLSVSFSDPSGVDAQTVSGDAVELTGPQGEAIPAALVSLDGLVASFQADLGRSPAPGRYLAAYTGTVADSLGNTGNSQGVGEVFVDEFNTMPPAVVAIARASQEAASFTGSQVFVVTFSEPVRGINLGSFIALAGVGLQSSIRRVSLPGGGAPGTAPAQTVLVEAQSSGIGDLTISASPQSGITDAAGNPLATVAEGFQPESYMVDTTPLRVVSLGPVETPRDRPVESIGIELSKPASSAGQIRSALLLQRNGRRFPLDAGFTVTQTGYSSYRIENFAAQSGVAGEYSLTLNAGLLTDPSGRPGTGSATVSWSAISPITTNSFNPVFSPPSTGAPDPFVVAVPKRVLLGTFSDSTGGQISDYSARVSWGDGAGAIPFNQLENAEILPSGVPGVYAVFGTHTYALDRNYLINVLIRDSAIGGSALLGLVESSSVVVTPLQASQLVTKQFVRGDTQTTIIAASLQPQGNSRPLLQVAFAQPPAVTGAERTIYLASYASNPETGSVPIAPSDISSVTWLDLRASGVNSATGNLVSTFAFSPAGDQEVFLFYYNSATGAYEAVLSSGGVAPAVDRASGLVTVTFDNTSTPKLANLNETVFAVTVSAASTSPTDSGSNGATAVSVVSTVNSTLVQASQTLTQLERSGQGTFDSASGSLATGLFVGGRSSTVALTPSALGAGGPARMRASAGSRLAMASSRDAAMALGGLLRGAIAPVERKLKPLMEALGITDQDSQPNGPPTPPMPEAPKPANPDAPRGAASGAGENLLPAAPMPSARLPESLRVLDEALATDDEALGIGPWAVAAAVLLAAVHIRPCRDPRKPEEVQGRPAPASE